MNMILHGIISSRFFVVLLAPFYTGQKCRLSDNRSVLLQKNESAYEIINLRAAREENVLSDFGCWTVGIHLELCECFAQVWWKIIMLFCFSWKSKAYNIWLYGGKWRLFQTQLHLLEGLRINCMGDFKSNKIF